jgi:hypothetical protein
VTENDSNLGSDFQKYLRRDARLRRMALTATILPLIVFLAFIYLAAREQGRLQSLRRQSVNLKNQISDNQNKLEQMKRDVNFYASQLTPSVDIFVAKEDQRPKADEAAEEIRKLNYNADIQDKPDPRIRNTYVRYFFKDDKQFADQIQQHIKSVGINAEVQSFADVDEADRRALGYIKPKTLELWLGTKYTPTVAPHITR